jgi:anti-sigma regulatory factor (Ser/Thr protein kinase)
MFRGRRDQIRLVRALLTSFLDGSSATDDAVLLISELATNACAHSASGRPGGMFTVRVEMCPGVYVHAEVEDQGSAWDGDIRTAEPPHGLFLLRALSAGCGARRGQHGWITWFTMASPQQAAPS